MQIYKLGELSEHCYQQWLTTSKTDLPSGAIKWIRDSLAEPGLADQTEKIFDAEIKPSEKCYRFLKLIGVIYRERLIQLLRKQVLDETEKEGTQRLREVDEKWRVKVDEQRQRIFNKPDDNSYSFTWFSVIVSVVFGILGAIVGGASTGISADIGWRVGLLIGVPVAYMYRKSRESTLVDDYIDGTKGEAEALRNAIEQNITNRKDSIDAEIPGLIKRYSLPLSESVRDEKSTTVANVGPENAKTRRAYPYAGLVAMLCLLLLVPSIFGKNRDTYQPPVPTQAPTPYTPAPTAATDRRELIQNRIDEIGNLVKQKKYFEAEKKVNDLDIKYPNLKDENISMAHLRNLVDYRTTINQNLNRADTIISKETFIIEGVVTSKSEMQGSGSFWYFDLEDQQGQKYDYFMCSSIQILYFKIDDKNIDYMDGYQKLKDVYSKVRVYIKNSDMEYFNKCKDKGCDGGICPVGIVMLSSR